jgi:serine/threonine-protein kinase
MTAPERLTAALSDRYRIEREIGRGGMATVYLAEDVRHGRKVAVKVLLPELAAVLGAERFLSEIHVTAALQHPHILPLFDSGQSDGQLFYVMPFVEGESLRSLLDRERQLGLDQALNIARQVGSALDYAHKHGVIHRDIKPENILLHDGHALVADFGIALAVTSAGGGRLTQTGLSLGTPQYMSPEQATGEREIGPRSDIYSLAAVTYEMLAGEPPHTGATMQAVIARMLTERPRSVRSLRSTVPEHVAAALDKALEKIPADRWHSATELTDALDGKIAVPAGNRDSSPRRERSIGAGQSASRLRDPLTIGLAIVALGGIAAAIFARVSQKPEEPGVSVQFPIVLPAGDQLMVGSQRSLALSPDGKTIAFTARAKGATERQLFIRTMNDMRIRRLSGTNVALNAFFSPDGKWIGFVDNSKLKKVSLDGGSVLELGESRGIYGGGTWTSRGEIIVSNETSRLYAIPENGGPARRVCKDIPANVLSEVEPETTPDGDTFLFSAGVTSDVAANRLGVGSLSSGKCVVLEIPTVQPLGIIDDLLVYASVSGAIMAVPFDLKGRKPTGSAVPILTDVDVNQTTGAMQASMSPTGSLLYLSGSATGQLVNVDMHGATAPLMDDSKGYAYPRYSPDGRRIAVAIATSGQRDIWLVDTRNKTTTRFTSANFNDRPEWTPDGKRLLYRSARSARSEIVWRAADMSDEETPLLANPAIDFYEGVITPDGQHVIYQLDTIGADVWYRRITGDPTSKAIASTPFIEDMARPSPNGRWVVYVSAESGRDEVYVKPFARPGPQVQVSVNGGDEPVWSPDGTRLYYRNEENFMSASIRAGDELEVISREVLFRDSFMKRSLPHANYDVAPDGRSLLMVKATEEPEVTVIYNWISELRSKVARR